MTERDTSAAATITCRNYTVPRDKDLLMTQLRWGLLGTARINRSLIPVLQGIPNISLRAVASRSADRARDLRGRMAHSWRHRARTNRCWPIRTSTPSTSRFPNSLHAEWTIRALDAGKHVLCEKPLALTVSDVDRVAEAAARTGRIAAEAFMYRSHPLTSTVDALLRSGRIGDLRFVRGAFTFPLTRSPDIRLDAALGGGSLWDVGCYPVSYTCFLLDAAPIEVMGWQEQTDTGVDVAFVGTMRFANGVLAQFDSGFRAAFRAEMELVGTDGLAKIERAFKGGPDSRVVLTRGDEVSLVPFDPQSSYARRSRRLCGSDHRTGTSAGTTPRVAPNH